jgi:hypothetical protein
LHQANYFGCSRYKIFTFGNDFWIRAIFPIQKTMFKSIFYAFLSLVAAQEGPIRNCGEASDPFQISSLSFSPYPIVAGKPVLVTSNGTSATKLAAGAKTKAVLKLGIVPIYREENDFCFGSAAAGSPCPFPAGKQTIKFIQYVPGIAPAGTFNLEVTVTSASGDRIVCFASKVKVVKG